MDSFLLILNTFKDVFSLLFLLWWVYLPFFLFYLAYLAIQNHNSLKYILGLKWVLLEIKVPKELHKSPKAMEQIFAGLHGVYAIPLSKWKDKFFEGKVLHWFSFEMVGKGGETHFFIRTLEQFRNIVEAQIYAQYPEAEVTEVSDYVNDLPLILPDDKYDLWGTDLILNKEDAYPIRTYPDFEEKGGPDDVRRIDPLASISELFSTLKAGEQIWIQILGAPTGDDWIKRGQKVLDKILGKEDDVKMGDLLSDTVFAIDKALNNLTSPAGEGEVKKEEKKKENLSPGKQEIVKTMEKSWDKLGYETCIRYLYISSKENFHQAQIAGISGSFKQFSSQNLNGFRSNKFTLTYAKGFRKNAKLLQKKRNIFQAYRERKLFTASTRRFVLNTEEMATIYHFPDVGVRSPLLPRIEAKKGEPPLGLPIA